MRPLQAHLPTPVSVQAEFKLRGHEILLQYKLDDPKHEVLDSLAPGNWLSFPRADELWKTTCLEAFWGVAGEKGYWELNLSPAKRAWNVYHFTGHRVPQPPARSEDFQLMTVEASGDSLSAKLTSRVPLANLEVSLTAIVRTAQATNYFALKHASPMPDFHARDTFVLGI